MERCRLKGKSEKNLSEKELKRCILSVDKRRAEYYSFATGQPCVAIINKASTNRLKLCFQVLKMHSAQGGYHTFQLTAKGRLIIALNIIIRTGTNGKLH